MIVVGMVMFTIGAFFAYTIFTHVQSVERRQSPFDDQGGQVAETLFGMAYGGVLGRGLGEGRPDIIVLTLGLDHRRVRGGAWPTGRW